MQGTEGGRVGGPERVSEHVVVEEVHVDGGNPAVEIGGHAEGEELAQPDREDDLEPQPAQPVVAHAVPLKEEAPEEAPELDRGKQEALGDDPAEEEGRS